MPTTIVLMYTNMNIGYTTNVRLFEVEIFHCLNNII